jgi:hypothetical protein
VAIRAANSHSASGVHGRLIGLCVTGNASGALPVGFLLRLAHQVWTGLFIGCAQRRRGNSRANQGKSQAHDEYRPLGNNREPRKVILFFHPDVHSVFHDQTVRPQRIQFASKLKMHIRK